MIGEHRTGYLNKFRMKENIKFTEIINFNLFQKKFVKSKQACQAKTVF